MSTPPFIPPRIAAFAVELHRDSGTEPVITREIAQHWRITMRNDRVVMTIDYRQLSRTRVAAAGSTLSIDGQRVKLASSYGHFLQTFADPDSHGEAPDITAPKGPLPSAPSTDAPGKVLIEIRTLRRTWGAGARIEVGRRGSWWSVSLYHNEIELHAYFLRWWHTGSLASRCSTPKEGGFQLLVSGEDVTSKVKGRLDKYLAQITVTQGTTSPAIATAADGKRSNTVETRKQTVVRT